MALARSELLCPVLVGRQQEEALLAVVLERARAGAVQAILLIGEGGVGKTRLCRWLSDEAAGLGLMPIIGHAFAQDSALPYGPFVDALARIFRQYAHDDIAPAVRPHARALATLFPELSALRPEATVAGTAVPTNAALQRRAIFDALIDTLFALAESFASARDPAGHVPLILLLEDLHWADSTSLELIQYLLQVRGGLSQEAVTGVKLRSPAQGLLLVATLRGEELQEGTDQGGYSALSRALASLVGQRLAREVRVTALGPADHAAMLAATLGRPVRASVAHALYQKSDGNPFVTEELLSALASSGQIPQGMADTPAREETAIALPLSLRAAVLARLDGLSAEARRVLSIAAVIGREFDFDVLLRVSGMDELVLLDLMHEGLRRQILTEDLSARTAHANAGGAYLNDGERFRFRHALTRDAIDGQLLARERRIWHRKIAEALEETLPATICTTTMAGSVALHFSLGGEPARAHPYAVRAAEHALGVGALAEAAEHLDRAVSALPDGDPAGIPLLEMQGRVRLALMEVPRAAELLWRSRSLCGQAGLRWQAAAIGSELAYLSWFTDPESSDREWTSLLAEATARCASEDPEDEASLRLYAAAAMCCGSNDAHSAALAWAERATTLSARLGPATERLLFRAYVGRGMAQVDIGGVESGLADLEHAIALGQRYGDPHLALAYNVLIMALCECGREDQAIEVLDRARQFEQRSGAIVAPPPVLYAYLNQGRWDEGLAVADGQLALYGSFGVPSSPQGLAMTAQGHLLERQGKAAEALALFEGGWERLCAVRDFAWAAPCLWGQARAYLALGKMDKARAIFQRCLDWWRETEDRGTVLPILLDAAFFAVSATDAVWGESCVSALELLAQGGNPVARAAALHARGRLSVAFGDREAGMAALRETIRAWDNLKRPFDEALASRQLGEALLAGSRDAARRAEAESLLSTAEQRFQRLGALAERAATEESRRRSGLLSQARRRDTLDAARAPHAGLTPRERDVLQCIAEGKTNREIAATLFIAEGTAELHVSRILGKLNCATRAQAAALAIAQGLATLRPQE